MRRCGLLALLLFVLVPSAQAAERWARPVPGGLARAFSYGADPFAARQHRGVDLAARRGQAVRAACGGRVVFAGRVSAGGGVVSVRCGRWRVSYVGLGTLGVREGEAVRARDRLGRAGGSAAAHHGLHLGVRREGARFGYVDPARFLREPAPPPLAPALRRAPPAQPLVAPLRLRPASAREPAPARPASAPAATRPVAPWPVWAGLALVLAGVAGSGYARRSGPRQRRQPSCPVSSTSSSWPTIPNGP